MDVATFCAESRVLVIAGKGGVGKTTVAATLARMAADAGLSVLVVELEGKSGISAAFGSPDPLGYDEVTLYRRPASGRAPGSRAGSGRAPGDPGAAGLVRGRRITPDDALLEYLADHGLQRVSRRLVSSGVVDVVSTAVPGIRDVLVLGKVKQLERDQVADLVVVDAPATGHAMTFLTSASGLLDAARGGPVRAQAADVVDLLTDPARCRVMLVTLPEEMPVSETVEAAYLLEDRAGVQLGPVVVNSMDEIPPGLSSSVADAAAAAGVDVPPALADVLEAARRFRLHRAALAAEQVARLARELPLPQLHLPRLHAAVLGPDEIGVLSRSMASAVADLTAAQAAR
ncbi:MAG: AAA family ATPase [Actinomycetota bacterium]|jgi:anion-transporting  ArsA/GET3 family ATPase|nr:AAA family ATPase [Actinomycetota bacterium]